MKKKLLVTLTVITMVVGIFSVTALAEGFETSLSFTYTPVTRDNLETVLDNGNDVSNGGKILAWGFYKKGELQYIFDDKGWCDINFHSISKPKNFDKIDKVMEQVVFEKDGVKYDTKNFTGVTANDIALDRPAIINIDKGPASGYRFGHIEDDHITTYKIDTFLLFNLEPVETEQNPGSETDNPKTADASSALPYGCVALVSLIFICLITRKIRRKQ